MKDSDVDKLKITCMIYISVADGSRLMSHLHLWYMNIWEKIIDSRNWYDKINYWKMVDPKNDKQMKTLV